MKPLGIVLLFINLLAAGGVAYLATQSWAKKQDQNIAVEKIELATTGFPTKKTTNDRALDSLKPDESVKLYGHDVRVKVLLDHFGQVPRGGDYTQMSANPPLSVVSEVEDMKKQIDTKLSGLGNDLAKLEYLVGTTNANNNRLNPGVLTLLADDVEERIAFRTWLAEAQKAPNVAIYPANELFALARSALDAKFELALADPSVEKSNAFEAAKRTAREARNKAYDTYQKADRGPGLDALQRAYLEAQMAYWKELAATTAKPASLSDNDRRRRAAGLLAVLDPSPVGQKRTALLVGLPDYTAAVLERTQRLTSMPERYERQGESELDTFSVVYKQKLKTSTDLDFMLQRQKDITKAFASQERIAATQVQSRTKHRDDAQGRVNDLDQKVKAASAAQQSLEKEIFELQKLVGARFDELFQLEDQVFQAEKQKTK